MFKNIIKQLGHITKLGCEENMVEKKEVLYSGDIEIALVTDAVDRIEEHWLEQIGVSDEDYLYIKKEENHLVIGKAEIEFIE